MRAFHIAWIALALLGWPVAAEDPPSPSTGDEATDELLAQERLRSSVESLFELYGGPDTSSEDPMDLAIRTAEGFVGLGPEVAPYLINELEQERYETYDLCCYALGLLGTLDGEEALRAAASRADEEPGHFARARKAWALWALGLQGQADAVRLLTEGRHRVAIHPMHGKTSAMEAVALLSAPKSLPVLLEVLEIVVADDERWQERRAVLHALRRLGDPAAAPKIIPLLKHADPNVRVGAADALRTMAVPEALDALYGALSDEDYTVRRVVASSLAYSNGAPRWKPIEERLKIEDDAFARGSLYRLLAEGAGAETFDRLIPYVGRTDPRDRRWLIQALGGVEDPRRLDMLRDALADEDNGVAFQASSILGNLRSDEAVAALIDAVLTARTPVARSAAGQLVASNTGRGGAAIAQRLAVELRAEDASNNRGRLAVEMLSGALVALDHTAAIRDLQALLEVPADPADHRAIEDALEQLEVIRRNRRKVGRWIETSRATEPELRRLTWERLGRIGTAEAARVLKDRFEDVGRTDREEILRALGNVPEEQAKPLIERVLLDAAFDPAAEAPLRAMAAWSARRIGSDAMFELLEAAARRRHGRDAKVLIYAGLLGGKRALPLLESLRPTRMRYLGWTRGMEQERLDWLARRLAAVRPVDELDLPPNKIFFR